MLGGYGLPQPLSAGGMFGSGVGVGVGVAMGVGTDVGAPEPPQAGSRDGRRTTMPMRTVRRWRGKRSISFVIKVEHVTVTRSKSSVKSNAVWSTFVLSPEQPRHKSFVSIEIGGCPPVL
jgi:hypothetical protein